MSDKIKFGLIYGLLFFLITVLTIISPLAGTSKPLHTEWQSFPNSFGYYGYQSLSIQNSGISNIELEYSPFLNYTKQQAVSPDYYITLFLNSNQGNLLNLPHWVEIDFAISGLLNTSRIQLDNASNSLISQTASWTDVPSDFISILPQPDNNQFDCVKQYNGTITDGKGNWTYFGKFTYNGGSVYGSTLLQLKTNYEEAKIFDQGSIQNISNNIIELTSMKKFMIRVGITWESRISALFPISTNNSVMYLGSGALGDMNSIHLLSS